jgi:hypothetical protein
MTLREKFEEFNYGLLMTDIRMLIVTKHVYMFIHNTQLSEVTGFVCQRVQLTCRSAIVWDTIRKANSLFMLLAVITSDVTVVVPFL